MLGRDTTFIVGAGASFDLGFPLGDTLRDRIIEILTVDDPNHSINFSDPDFSRVMQARAVSEAGTGAWPDRLEVYRRAAATIRDGLPFARSIDTFIDGLRHQEHIEFLSKLAIATVILRAEAGSPLVPRHVQAANTMHLKYVLREVQTDHLDVSHRRSPSSSSAEHPAGRLESRPRHHNRTTSAVLPTPDIRHSFMSSLAAYTGQCC